ncbi:MAG TPA: hypothetical protein VNM24_14095 [Burkholderiales bacterium]|nr:hypothetical protein [Burkholderiales bacterium]
MTLETPLERLQEVAIAVAMRESLWLYPVVETAHILGFIVLVGAVVMFDLRVLGLSDRLPVRKLGAHLLPWSAASLILVVPTGLLMFLADAAALVSNPAFILKMVLLLCAGANAAAFHLGAYRSVATWDMGMPSPPAARLHATVSLLLWIAIVGCGRAIAYV